MNNSLDVFRSFLFRGLMLESETIEFQKAGIQIGADLSQAEERLLSEALAPFGVSLRNHGVEMARLYAVLHCFENSIRTLIKETLVENYGAEWENHIPSNVTTIAQSRQKDAFKNSWIEGEKESILGFVNFGNLSSIIVENWELFDSIIPSQHWLKQRMDELEKVRNFIAHNRMLLPGEFKRIYMYIADWNRAIGL